MRAFQPLHLPIRAVQSTTQCLRQRLITPYAFSHPQSSVFQSFPANRTSPFSTSTTLLARKNRGPKKDQRISIIRYHLQHPVNPRPLRFSRSRHLRHWTIHRAWQMHRAQQRTQQQLTLERQYNSMRAACEALRLTGEDGLSITEAGRAPRGLRDLKTAGIMDVQQAAERQKEVGRLFRVAMLKDGVWEGVPIEYARHQTETPPRAGWDHAWTR